MPNQPVTVHQKLVAFSLASEDGMIVNYKARLAFPGLALKYERRRQAANSSTHDCAIVALSSVDGIARKILKCAIANLVASLEHGSGVAVRVRVIPNPAITCPIVVGTRCGGPREQPHRRS